MEGEPIVEKNALTRLPTGGLQTIVVEPPKMESPRTTMTGRRPTSAGFTLLELLLVVMIVGILVGIVLPDSQPTVYDQLRSTAQLMCTDLAYARSLAVAHDSAYRVAFDLTANRYVLTHAGTDASLNVLPKSPFACSGDAATQQIVDLDELPHTGPTVRLRAVRTTAGSVDRVEFGPLGSTTATDATTIWLSAGSGNDAKYLSIVVSSATGLSWIDQYTGTAP
ncbi:MAG: GspH/FimT family pseudopilin [Thermoguttaceae bacterium]